MDEVIEEDTSENIADDGEDEDDADDELEIVDIVEEAILGSEVAADPTEKSC